MNSEDKIELIVRLRDLALKLEHGIPLQKKVFVGTWERLGLDGLSPWLDCLRALRAEPAPSPKEGDQ